MKKQKNIQIITAGILVIIAVVLVLILRGNIPSDFNGIWFEDEVNPDTGSMGVCKPRENQTGFFQCCFNYEGQQVDCRNANKILGMPAMAVYRGTPGVGTAVHGFSIKNTGNIDFTAQLQSFTWSADEILSGLISWWTMEEILGNTSIDSVGDNYGTIYGANQIEGHIGKALEFDGINDYVDYGNDNSLQPKEALSLDLWIKPSEGQEYCYDGTEGNYGIVGSVDGAESTSTWSWQLRYGSPDVCSLGMQLNTVAGSKWVNVGYNLPTTEWTHIAITFNGIDEKMYVNGVLTDAISFASTTLITDIDNKILLGSAGWGSSNTYYKGAIDEVKIYNRELSGSEIEALSQGTQVPTADVTFLNDKWNLIVSKPKLVIQGTQASWATDPINVQVGCPIELTTYNIQANAKATTTIEGVSYDDFKTLKASFNCQRETISLDFDIIF